VPGFFGKSYRYFCLFFLYRDFVSQGVLDESNPVMETNSGKLLIIFASFTMMTEALLSAAGNGSGIN
jgi:hypothetical protein